MTLKIVWPYNKFIFPMRTKNGKIKANFLSCDRKVGYVMISIFAYFFDLCIKLSIINFLSAILTLRFNK
jgi:hypothetical protein